jgi:hypothetical protein
VDVIEGVGIQLRNPQVVAAAPAGGYMWFPTRFQQLGDGIAAAIPPIVINKEHVMNTKSLLASLFVLGSSSVAMASPSVTFSATAKASYGAPYAAPIVRDHRIDPDCETPVATPVILPAYHGGPIWRGEPRPVVYRPVMLGSDLHFAGDGRTFLTVGDQMGRFGTLQIKAARGRTFIKQVYVQFENGQEQVIRNINRTLDGHDSLSLDLDGNRRGIKRIVVYGNELGHGWNRWRTAGTFSVTAS